MKKFVYLILLSTMCNFIVGCSHTYLLDQYDVEKYNERIKGVQVYAYSMIGSSIIYKASYDVNNTSRTVNEGIAKEYQHSSTTEHEIKITHGTPGVIAAIDNDKFNWVKVDFGDGIILKFSQGKGDIS
jgi:hypothetical protein